MIQVLHYVHLTFYGTFGSIIYYSFVDLFLLFWYREHVWFLEICERLISYISTEFRAIR